MAYLRLTVLTAVLVGLATMAAEPAPALTLPTDAIDAAVAKLLPTPRLFEMEVTHLVPPKSETVQMCMGADTMLSFFSALKADPEALAALAKGCTQNRTKTPDGGVKLEQVCDKAAGAAWTSHMTIETASDLHEAKMHMEMEMDLGGKTQTIAQDMHLTLLGDCPADLKSGQMRQVSGEVFDFGGFLSGQAKVPPPKP
jgi:hypothetical protein